MPAAHLHRVLKRIKHNDGQSHKQAFYVKKASPGDVYAQNRTTPEPNQVQPMATPTVGHNEVDLQDRPVGAEPPGAQEHRIEVQPITIPWVLAGESEEAHDPVPAEIRKRFDPDNRAQRHKDPINSNVPLFTIKPGEDMLWGAPEQDILNRLRSGTIIGIRASSANGHPAMVKIEATDGVVERAYIRFEGLKDEDDYDLFGDMYDIHRGSGDFSRRSAAAYEVAKAAGFDDLVPPTVYRYNQYDGLEPILSTEAQEMLADSLAVSKDIIPSMIGDSAAIELWTDEAVSLCEVPSFQLMLADNDLLNTFYSSIPEYRMPLLRAAVYDFLVWHGSRTWMSVLVCPSDRHPLILINNETTIPDPIALGTAYLDYQCTYSDACPSNLIYMPMLWNDLIMTAALRGYDEDSEIYDEIAYNCAKRLRGERVVDLIRSLNDHKVSELAIAGVLVRAAFLRYGARQVMRDPLVVARYFSSILTGEQFDPGFDIDLEAMETSIDAAMNKAMYSDFSLRQAMSNGSNEEDIDDGSSG